MDYIDIRDLRLIIKSNYSKDINLAELEVIWVEAAFKEAKQNITLTAKRLGVSRATMYRKLKELNGRS